MSGPGVRVRFAPSPTGRLHVGNARTALYNWLFARGRGGAFVLRIEDTDVERNEPDAEGGILEDLHWLGLDWDEGPDRGGPRGPYRQSERAASYREAGRRLLESEDAYRCFCSAAALEADREAQRAEGRPPRYSGACRGIPRGESERRAASGEPHVLRLRVRASSVSFEDAVRGRVTFPGDQIGDLVLARSDGRAAYNFAVVVDDLEMRITHVIRGEDHLSNTPRQILLYRALGAEPPVFAHLSMILGPDGGRLHKRHGAVSVTQLRQAGHPPEALLNYLALLGWSHPSGTEVLSVGDLVASFALDRVSGSAATFDPAKLAFLTAHHVRTMPPGRLLDLARPFLRAAGLDPDAGGAAGADWWGRALAAVSGQMSTLADAPAAAGVLFEGFDRAAPPLEPGDGALLAALEAAAAGRDLARPGAFRECAVAAGASAGRKGRTLFHPLRLALTARETGPELDRLVPLVEEGSRLTLGARVPGCLERIGAARARSGGSAG